MDKLDKVLYTARAHTTGGREGSSKTDDGALDLKLVKPGKGGGTNPEQLFASGYSACFLGAVKAMAQRKNVTLSDDSAVDAEVDLGKSGEGVAIAARLKVTLPGVDKAQAKEIVDMAHQFCPYSRATRGNIDVQIEVA